MVGTWICLNIEPVAFEDRASEPSVVNDATVY